jgi:hypothetical protein
MAGPVQVCVRSERSSPDLDPLIGVNGTRLLVQRSRLLHGLSYPSASTFLFVLAFTKNPLTL